MKLPKLSLNQFLQLALVFALVVNCVIHFSSPAYLFYKENFENQNKRIDNFERRVKLDFIPAVLALSSNRTDVVVVSNNTSSVLTGSVTDSYLLQTGSSNDVSRLFSLDFRWFVNNGEYGFELDGQRYYAGDDFFGSVIRSVSPTIIVTDQYQFVKPLLSKFTEGGSKSDSKSLTSHEVFPTVPDQPSKVVPQGSDVYNPYRKSPLYEY